MKIKSRRIVAIVLCAVMMVTVWVSEGTSLTGNAGNLAVTDTAKVYGTDWRDEYVVANINVKDAPYNAKGDGITDDTQAIQNALNAVEAGGIVYIPAGDYVIKGSLNIPAQCTLIGDWELPYNKDRKETVLLAYKDRGTDFGLPFISMGTASTLKNISVYYPEQTADDIQPYPYTIGFQGVSVLVDSVTLYNSYNGINTHMSNGSAQHVFHVYGTPLNTGVSFDVNLEVSELAYVDFDIDIWADSGRKGAPITKEEKQKVRKQTRQAKAIACGRIDDMYLYDIDVDANDYATGVYFYQNTTNDTTLQGGAYGHFLKLHDTNVYVEGTSTFGVGLDFMDDIVEQKTMSYSLATGIRTTKDKILSIKEPPYNAVGDGVTDDTQAIKKCIADIAKNGGGIVFIPQGQFKVTESIEIPSNVELRGVMTAPHTAFSKPCSQLNIYADPSGKPAVILSDSAGVNGLSFYYPENKLTELVEFPYTIQGNGDHVWVKSTTFINAYDAIDLATNKCDNFFVGNTWGTAMRYGIYVGGGSENGVIENTLFTFGVWQETRNLHGNASLNTMTSLFKANSIAYVFEDCKNLVGFSVFGFGNRIGTWFKDKDGKTIDDAIFYRLGLDTPWAESSLRIDNAGDVEIYGLATASHQGPGVFEVGDVKGTVNIYGQNIWGGCSNDIKDSGKVNIYSTINGFFSNGENVLASIKEIKASSESFNFEFAKDNVHDQFRYTTWQPDEADENPSLIFELEKAQKIKSIAIYHGASRSGNTSSNAKNYTIQASQDGTTYKNVMKVTDNTDTIALHDIKDTKAKYFKIVFDADGQEMPVEIGDVKLLTEEVDLSVDDTKDNEEVEINGKLIMFVVIGASVLLLIWVVVLLEISRRRREKK